ncbi:MAG: TAT-variant-translocated molybdopterin oxidoreductase, partial [Myxococcaceae bacterium]
MGESDPSGPQPPRLWKSIEEAGGVAPVAGEFPEGAQEPMTAPDDGPSRRRFLGLLGASAALATSAGCSRKIDRGPIVPYTRKPVEVVPGVANFYASTFQEGTSSYGVLVKAREGRPIHVEGNDEHPFSRGKAPFRATADLLGLYDPDRLRTPLLDGTPAAWADALGRVVAGVKDAATKGEGVLLMTGAVSSPTQKALLDELRRLMPSSLRHVQVEPAADHAARRAALDAFGEARAVRYRYDRADLVLSLGADFLGTMEGAVGAISGFAARRKPAGVAAPMSRLYAFEGEMTLTGSKADHRFAVRPSALSKLGFALARSLHDHHGLALPAGVLPEAFPPFDLKKVAAESGLAPSLLEALVTDLARSQGAVLAVAGPSAPPDAHVACHVLNAMLGAEGKTIESDTAPDGPEVASPAELDALVGELAAGKFSAAILWGANPGYHHPDSAAWSAAFAKVPLRVRLSLLADETAQASQVVLPVNHWLESWGDFQPATDLLSLRQPLIAPLFDSRQGEEVLLALAAGLGAKVPADYQSYLRQRWEGLKPAGPLSFEAFWNASLHDGVARLSAEPRPARALKPPAMLVAAANARQSTPAKGLELVLHPCAKVYDGRYANNGWLQELPDPVSKVTWNNPVLVSVADAGRLGLNNGDDLKLEVGGRSVVAGALVQPGQAEGVLSLALGYGRLTGNVAHAVGVNAWPLTGSAAASPFLAQGVTATRTGAARLLARTQEHHSLGGREIAKLWTRAEYAKEARPPEEHPASLYPDHRYPNHKWGMAIDLSGCVGCSGCVIACQSENNVPVVGPEQVAKGREMAWLRIDRYYEGPPEAPRVVHEPMLCQHCDNAPCENVCPVAATTHSPDGLNQMTYNRCVGTRYCANNCPYKVRRFNFFEFNQSGGEVRDLAFNPEVTVRPRGVMEKCSFCVQRISTATQVARADGRRVRDGEIKP